MESNHPQIKLLDGTNWSSWSTRINMIFATRNLSRFIETREEFTRNEENNQNQELSDEISEAAAANVDQRRLRRRRERAVANRIAEINRRYNVIQQETFEIIMSNVNDRELMRISKVTTGREAWNIYREYYSRVSIEAVTRTERQLYNLQMENGGNLEKHLEFIQDLLDNLEELGSPMTESKQVSIILTSLPSEYASFVSIIDTPEARDNLTINSLTPRLLEEYEKRHGRSVRSEVRVVNNRDLREYLNNRGNNSMRGNSNYRGNTRDITPSRGNSRIAGSYTGTPRNQTHIHWISDEFKCSRCRGDGHNREDCLIAAEDLYDVIRRNLELEHENYSDEEEQFEEEIGYLTSGYSDEEEESDEEEGYNLDDYLDYEEKFDFPEMDDDYWTAVYSDEEEYSSVKEEENYHQYVWKYFDKEENSLSEEHSSVEEEENLSSSNCPVATDLSRDFEMTNLGGVAQYLGIKYHRDSAERFANSQSSYINRTNTKVSKSPIIKYYSDHEENSESEEHSSVEEEEYSVEEGNSLTEENSKDKCYDSSLHEENSLVKEEEDLRSINEALTLRIEELPMINHHNIRDGKSGRKVNLVYTSTDELTADIIRKSLESVKMKKHRKRLGIINEDVS
jgi:hypothetical protein